MEKDLDFEYCQECGGQLIIESYEKTCKNCGLVAEELFGPTSFISDENLFEKSSNKQYVAIGNRPDFIGGLGTFIDYENSKYLKDKSGRLLPPKEQKLFRRLKKNYAKFIRIKNHETEYRIFHILNNISLYLNLTDNIKKRAAYFYKKILKNEEKVINNISLIAFCIFYSIRADKHNAPVTVGEIADAFQNYGHRVNARLILRDGIKYKKHLAGNTRPHKSEDYLIRLLNGVANLENLEGRLIKKRISWSKKEYHDFLLKKCNLILKNLSKWQRGGRNPFILTGGVIYLADRLLAEEYGQKKILTQKMISKATGIAEYSIRDHYVNLLKPLFIKK